MKRNDWKPEIEPQVIEEAHIATPEELAALGLRFFIIGGSDSPEKE